MVRARSRRRKKSSIEFIFPALFVLVVTFGVYLIIQPDMLDVLMDRGKQPAEDGGEVPVDGDDAVGVEDESLPMEFSTWLVDWEWNAGLEDFKLVSEELANVQLFAAYFNENASLLLTDDFHEMLPEFGETATEMGAENVYVTIVNDVIFANGSSQQKDPVLVSRLVADESSRSQHISEIIDVVNEYDFAGVEIDYEKIMEADWDRVATFYEELYVALDAEGKDLRVVLEPNVPVERVSLPAGPTYVMMAYNLYGTHSGPGPKADFDLITEVAAKLGQIEGNHYLALSAGGFDWRKDGMVTPLTEVKAAALAALSPESVARDEASGAVHFTYFDDDGREHTVWYADDETFTKWIEVAREQGINRIALWRLGEIEAPTLDVFNQLYLY